jgi:acyl-CoA synthetase (AMP-forming)/AMP-acid ligase II
MTESSHIKTTSLEEATARGQFLIRKIEDAIYRHPSVNETVAVFIPDMYGESDLAAFIVPSDVNLSVQEIKHFIEDSGLLTPEERPRRYHLVSEIPKTPSGKCQKQKLLQNLTGVD